MSTENKLHITNNETARRFEVEVDGEVGFVTYEIRDNIIALTSTHVPPAIEGRGIGSQLAQYSMEYARDHGYKVVPMCSFIAHYISQHPEYQDMVPA
ncbi:N-acetyltransferase [Phototrophicus methaneseepsis]|uniref:N-acetyltransferase n=1 Tax=Phototrophicus methaneseepsis TaxID=2710758 RepID=A0A7S8ECF2_9CHLR|nr:GNAT family N-acetyltransferase [Phototrophicus methaneseepsis]QPC84369.1 N-acetyltransferase [Phototrophicus methaneseepsis]